MSPSRGVSGAERPPRLIGGQLVADVAATARGVSLAVALIPNEILAALDRSRLATRLGGKLLCLFLPERVTVSSHSLTELLQERHKGRLPLADARRCGSEVRSPSVRRAPRRHLRRRPANRRPLHGSGNRPRLPRRSAIRLRR